MSKKGLGKFVLGAGIGAGLALLFAPKKGSDLRRDIKRKFDELMKDVDKIEIEDIKESFTKKVDEIKKELEDLDKEKVKKIAEKKAKELKKKTEELVEYAKEKGTPVLEKAAKEVKKQAANVCKEVLNKLEEKSLLENTVIVVYTDHYLYTLSDQTILDKYKDTKNNLINHTPFFIYDGKTKNRYIYIRLKSRCYCNGKSI